MKIFYLNVHKIIQLFRYHMSPALIGQTQYFAAPSQFVLTYCYKGKDNNYIPKIAKCVLENVEVGTVVKSSKGAGSESTFYLYDEQFLQKEILEQLIGESLPNGESFFPCFVMDYIDVEFEHRIVITEDEIYGCKLRQFKEWDSPTNFPHNIDYLQTEWYKRPQPNMIGLEEKDFSKGLLQEIIRIKKELNTPNLKFDILDNKILEFSYVLYNNTVT